MPYPLSRILLIRLMIKGDFYVVISISASTAKALGFITAPRLDGWN